MASASYGDRLVQNISAERVRKKLDQGQVAARMRALGFTNWHRQTLGKVERGERRLLADELLWLAVAMDITVSVLTTARDEDGPVEAPAGLAIPARRTLFDDGSVRWDGDRPVLSSATAEQEARRRLMHSEARAVQKAQSRGVDVAIEVDPEDVE